VQARVKVRVICTRAYHALFMRNMMIRPTEAELKSFGEADFTIYNAGVCPADPTVPGVSSNTSVAIDIDNREMIILGTEYAGEMKKGIFSVMHYLMPCRDILTLHSGCNMGADNDVTLFFGLSGTGTTTPHSNSAGACKHSQALNTSVVHVLVEDVDRAQMQAKLLCPRTPGGL
jgi:phosphoenolpyruvate carboxykinase (ATP)